MSVEEGVALLKKCIGEVQKRLIVNLPTFKVNLIEKDQVRELEHIKVDLTTIGLTA